MTPHRTIRLERAGRAHAAGFTLIELLIVIAVIGILIALLLPAVQAARESARRQQCANRLCQLSIALHNYVEAHGVLSPGTIDAAGPIPSRPIGYHMSWVAQILPYIERQNVFHRIDFTVGAYDPPNAEVRRISIPLLRCPTSRGSWQRNGVNCNYAGCHHDLEAPIDADNHGVLFLNSFVSWKDITDGRAQTILLGEKLDQVFELGWISGTRSTLRNTGTPINRTSAPGGPLALAVDLGAIGDPPPPANMLPPQPKPSDEPRPMWQFPGDEQTIASGGGVEHEYQPPAVPGGVAPSLVVGGFESQHVHGSHFAFGDGSVRFVSEYIDLATYQQLGHRADGKLLNDRF